MYNIEITEEERQALLELVRKEIHSNPLQTSQPHYLLEQLEELFDQVVVSRCHGVDTATPLPFLYNYTDLIYYYN